MDDNTYPGGSLWELSYIICVEGFPGSSADKESACNAGDPGVIPGWGRSPGEGRGYPLQYCGLENSMDCTVHRIAKSRTRLMQLSSSSSNAWEIDGETVETVSDFTFGGSKITADGDCSHEVKRHLLLGRKVMTNLDSIFKLETLLCRLRSV